MTQRPESCKPSEVSEDSLGSGVRIPAGPLRLSRQNIRAISTGILKVLNAPPTYTQ